MEPSKIIIWMRNGSFVKLPIQFWFFIWIAASNSGTSLLLKKAKKSYSFHPPDVTPSVSINKPRINGDDAKKLKDYFEAVTSPHSGDETLDCTLQEYELNMEEQQVLHCLKKRPVYLILWTFAWMELWIIYWTAWMTSRLIYITPIILYLTPQIHHYLHNLI